MILWSVAGAGVLALMALAVVFRVEVVRAWPRTASAYAAAGFTVTAEGLVFENIAAEPGYAQVRADLEARLDAEKRRTGFVMCRSLEP